MKKEMATHSNILAWRIPWREEPGGLQSMGSQRVGHSLAVERTHTSYVLFSSQQPFCCGSVTQSCPTLCDPTDCSTPGYPVLHHLSLLRLMFIELAMLSSHLIFCHPLPLLPSIFPSIRVFSNELVLIRTLVFTR